MLKIIKELEHYVILVFWIWIRERHRTSGVISIMIHLFHDNLYSFRAMGNMVNLAKMTKTFQPVTKTEMIHKQRIRSLCGWSYAS
jgi:hypothetical protein